MTLTLQSLTSSPKHRTLLQPRPSDPQPHSDHPHALRPALPQRSRQPVRRALPLALRQVGHQHQGIADLDLHRAMPMGGPRLRGLVSSVSGVSVPGARDGGEAGGVYACGSGDVVGRGGVGEGGDDGFCGFCFFLCVVLFSSGHRRFSFPWPDAVLSFFSISFSFLLHPPPSILSPPSRSPPHPTSDNPNIHTSSKATTPTPTPSSSTPHTR